jgi:hypothetical protein
MLTPLKAGRRYSIIRGVLQEGQAGSVLGHLSGVVKRTSSWHNAHKKLVWCTEREGRVIDFWVAFPEVFIIVRRLTREAWSRYRWETRQPRRP